MNGGVVPWFEISPCQSHAAVVGPADPPYTPPSTKGRLHLNCSNRCCVAGSTMKSNAVAAPPRFVPAPAVSGTYSLVRFSTGKLRSAASAPPSNRRFENQLCCPESPSPCFVAPQGPTPQ